MWLNCWFSWLALSYLACDIRAKISAYCVMNDSESMVFFVVLGSSWGIWVWALTSMVGAKFPAINVIMRSVVNVFIGSLHPVFLKFLW